MKPLRIVVWGAALVLGAVVIMQYAGGVKLDRANKKRVTKAAMAVRILPPGTKEVWLQYVDRRFSALLHREGAVIHITSIFGDVLGGHRFVSANTPYIISCDPLLGGSIRFGYGENAIEVYLYGLLAWGTHHHPPLGVHRQSIAAKRLYEDLCARITERVKKMMAR